MTTILAFAVLSLLLLAVIGAVATPATLRTPVTRWSVADLVAKARLGFHVVADLGRLRGEQLTRLGH